MKETRASLGGGGRSLSGKRKQHAETPGARDLGTFETALDYSAWRVRYQVGEGRDEAGERVLNAVRRKYPHFKKRIPKMHVSRPVGGFSTEL